MQWWDNFVNWFYSDAGSHVFETAIIPGVAILVAGVIAALIGRGSTKRVVGLHDRAERIAAVTAMISAARRAANWNSLSVHEQKQADHIALECDIRLRLLPLAGSGMAAEWATHELAELKKQAVSFSFQATQSLKEFRDRLIDWQARPSRAKKLFKNDLDSWAYEASLSDQDLVAQQKAWEDQQAAASARQPEAHTPEAHTPEAHTPEAHTPGVSTPVVSMPEAPHPNALGIQNPLAAPASAPEPPAASTELPPTQ